MNLSKLDLTDQNADDNDDDIDWMLILKASQAMAGELALDRLLETLMKIFMEIAAPTTGFLLLEQAGEWKIEVSATRKTDVSGTVPMIVLESIPILQHLPIAIINAVIQTQKTLMLNPATATDPLLNVPYFENTQIESLCCLPLLNQHQLAGILYLENSSKLAAFTPHQWQSLQLLSESAAMAIHNAQKYTALQRSEQELRDSTNQLNQFLEAVPVGIFITNIQGQPYYMNSCAQQLLGQGIISNHGAENLREIYQAYLAETHTIYPKERDPLLCALQGKSSRIDDMEIHRSEKIIPIDVWASPIYDKMGQIVYAIAAFQDTTERKQVEKLMTEYNRTLEQQVAERTQELSQTLTYLQATQKELIQSEKMAALGQLISGIAHEINTPLGAIRSSIENIAEFLKQNLLQFPEFFQTLSPERQPDFFNLLKLSMQKTIFLSSKEKRQIRKDLQRQLELCGLKNLENIDIIVSNLVDIGVWDEGEKWVPLLQDPEAERILKIAYQFASIQRSTRTISIATDRAAKVLFALKSYARYDQSQAKSQAQITESIETVLTLYQNQLKHGVEVMRSYQENLPIIWCYPDELTQVWTNLVHNALQAMNHKGILTIDVTQSHQEIQVKIMDTGAGIPPEIMPRIFEPFFTTKPLGEGSGLGLDIVKRIVDKHGGKIQVESVPGQTTFTVLIPVNLSNESDKLE